MLRDSAGLSMAIMATTKVGPLRTCGQNVLFTLKRRRRCCRGYAGRRTHWRGGVGSWRESESDGIEVPAEHTKQTGKSSAMQCRLDQADSILRAARESREPAKERPIASG
jgi:hypothetical protein